MRAGEDEGVVHASRVGAGGDEGDVAEVVQRLEARHVHVEVDAAEMVEQGVAQDIGALDALLVAAVVWEDVRVVLGHERIRALVGPEIVRPVRVHGPAALDRGLILCQLGGPALGQKDLVDDLWCELAIACFWRRRAGGLRISIQRLGVPAEEGVECAVCSRDLSEVS